MSLQTDQHYVLKRIKYRSHLEGERYIDPHPKNEDGTEQTITLGHLSDEDILLLRKLKIVKKAPKKAQKEVKDHASNN